MSMASSSARSRSRAKSGIVFEFGQDGEATRVKLRPDVDPSDVNSVEQVERTARDYDDKIPGGVLPGSGPVGEDCGDPIPALFCPEEGCGEVYEPGRTCRRSRCPRCWQSWDFQRALSMASKLESLGRTRGANGKNTKMHHLTVSFRESTRFNSKKPLDRAIEAVKRLLEEVNVDTGYIVYHPYRIREEYRGEVKGHDSGDGDMTWSDVLGKVEGDEWPWEAVRDEFLTYAPHFHVLGLSEFVQGGAVSKAIEDETGVVIERITKRDSPVSIYDLEDLCRATAYCLSHAALTYRESDGAFQSVVRPFGEVANFEAYDNVKAETKETLRRVAPDVLGVEFPEPRCSEERPTDADECGHGHDRADEQGHVPAGAPAAAPIAATGGRATTDATAGTAWSEGSNTGFTDETDAWAATTGHVPKFTRDVTEVSEKDTERCGGRLVPMWEAESYLEDDGWMDTLDPTRRRTLSEKHEEWVELGRPMPEDVPVAEAGPPPAD